VGVGVGFRRRAVALTRAGATGNRLPFTAAAVLRIAVPVRSLWVEHTV
jgi:hypothetical protein